MSEVPWDNHQVNTRVLPPLLLYRHCRSSMSIANVNVVNVLPLHPPPSASWSCLQLIVDLLVALQLSLSIALTHPPFYHTSSSQSLPAFSGWFLHFIYCWPLLVVMVVMDICFPPNWKWWQIHCHCCCHCHDPLLFARGAINAHQHCQGQHIVLIRMRSTLLWHVTQLFYIILQQC